MTLGLLALAGSQRRLRNQGPDPGFVCDLGKGLELLVRDSELFPSLAQTPRGVHEPALDEVLSHPHQVSLGKGSVSAVRAWFQSGVQHLLRSERQTGDMRVLVVDDEPAVRKALERALRFEGYTAELAEDGMAGLAAHAERPADAIVLDIAMPRLDGLEMCRRLRAAGDRTPVLMLTARAAVTERVDGLDAGADDYLVKPFALEELLARMRALLRRSAPTADNEVLRFADLSLDPGTREVRRGQRLIELTRTEFLLLELFLRNPKQVLPREVIFDRVWGYDFGLNSNSLEVYIGYLRRKTEAGGEPRLIHTVRGVGYVMRLPSEMRG